MSRIAVIGTGYVGLTTGACFSHLGHEVVCADIDAAKIKRLNAGEIPIVEAGVDKLVAEGLSSGRLRFVLGAAAAAATCEFAYLCVPTPQGAFQQAFPSALPLLGQIHSETSQHHDGDRVASHSLGDARRCHLMPDGADGQGVIADYHAVTVRNIGLSAVGLVIGESEALEKTVQFVLAAVEALGAVGDTKFLNGRQRA